MARYSDNFNRDWDFYVRHRATFDFGGSMRSNEIEHDPEGVTAKRAFHLYDSQGVMRPTSEPRLLGEVLVCKAGVNLHIKMWAEGLVNGTLWVPDLIEIAREYEPPPWLWSALWRQAAKLHSERRQATPEGSGLPTEMHNVAALSRLRQLIGMA